MKGMKTIVGKNLNSIPRDELQAANTHTVIDAAMKGTRYELDFLITAISVLFLHSALLTVVGVTDARTPTDDAPGKEDELHLFNVQRRFQPALIRAVVALVANPDESTRPNIGVTDDALPITLLAQTPWFLF